MPIAPRKLVTNNNATSSFYISLSDLLLLICAFFVFIFSISKVETGSYERVRSSLTGTTSGTLVELKKKLSDAATGLRGVSVTYDADGVRVNLDTSALFPVASARLHPGALDSVHRMLQLIRPTPYKIDVEGHSDDQTLFRVVADGIDSNWSLSGRRAASVVHYLLRLGFEPSRLKVVGYGATKPKVAVAGKAGSALEQARTANRRVSLLIH